MGSLHKFSVLTRHNPTHKMRFTIPILFLSVLLINGASSFSFGLLDFTPSTTCTSDSQCSTICVSRTTTRKGCSLENKLFGRRNNCVVNYRQCAECLADRDCNSYSRCRSQRCEVRPEVRHSFNVCRLGQDDNDSGFRCRVSSGCYSCL